jgi:hypothetical protein
MKRPAALTTILHWLHEAGLWASVAIVLFVTFVWFAIALFGY